MKHGYEVRNRKVAIIGAGFVGSSIAYALALRDIAREVVLIDISRKRSEGEAWDIRHGIPALGTADIYAGDYSDCADCDLIIITAGRNRRPGESRLDLAVENIEVMRTIIDSIKPHYTHGVILIISNPVDILTQKASEWMGLTDGTVFGSGCILDTSRFVRCIADYVGLNTGMVNGYVVGEHGEGQVPVWSHVTVDGIPIGEYCSAMSITWDGEIRAMLAEKTRKMGTEIIKAKGTTHYGIATCVCYLADAVLNQKPVIASVTSPLAGEQDMHGVSLSVPSVVGPFGVQQKVQEKWASEEYRGFLNAVEEMRDFVEKIGK